ncbi:hypothetical protein C7B69_01105 [filamentous cyanobacterium Phorm 46]|nr:hypothetical protein C7B69_01105 [filamentous cyanobacterium Phorm 46]PSB51407.1 hypothetical protein C7B67_11010 [filamentous cyanobacterium Phorm 6]
MTELLERVIAKLKTLPASEQDALAKPSKRIASMILEELQDDLRWERAFASSPDALAKLAANAMAEYRAGKTQELDPETL